MARRNDHSRDALKQMIIDAATDLVVEEGVSALSARHIATRIGYTVGTLYNVFTNLDDIILHVNLGTLSKLHEHLTQALANESRPSFAMFALAGGYMDFYAKHHSLWLLLFCHQLPANTELPSWFREKLETVVALFQQTFLSSLGYDKKKAREAAETIWAALHGVCALQLPAPAEAGNEPMSRHALAESLISNYLRGLKSK